tara:strand:+ start:16043 stop:16723 length:681 start_codon:yes stop_codon:yes gene_type:complete
MHKAKQCGLVFDLDGTLIESAPAIRAVGNQFLASLNLEPLSLGETVACIGGGSPQFVRLILEARSAYEEAVFDDRFLQFTKLYNAASPHLNRPFEGAEDALRSLASAGHALALCTNKPAAPTMKVLDALGWSNLFGAVIAGDTLPIRKPDPAPLLEAARRIDCQSILYFGDSEVDAETAVNASVPFVLFTEGYRKATEDELVHVARYSSYSEFGSVVASALHSNAK